MTGEDRPDLFPGRVSSNAVVEYIARAIFPELEGAPPHNVARRMGDVRDGLPVATMSQVQRERVEAAARVAGVAR